jgi:Fe-S-cluster containining protein
MRVRRFVLSGYMFEVLNHSRSFPTFNYLTALAGLMRCSHCEKCCQATEMELCEADIARMERGGYRREDFSSRGADGIPRLRNVGEHCFFYDHERKRCKEYARRPLGCVIYPVNISVDGEIVIDELCPEGNTMSFDEVGSKGRRLRELLNTIALEAQRWLQKG